MKKIWGIRVDEEAETAGLDVSEHGMWGYPEFYIPVPGGYGTESHSHLGTRTTRSRPCSSRHVCARAHSSRGARVSGATDEGAADGRPSSSSPRTRTIVRLDLCRMLVERAGFDEVVEARDGEEAVALAREHRPDLAILDVNMPKLDGIEAARRILAERPLPIVMLTAYADEASVARAVEAGVFAYVVKPFREQDLLPAIRTAQARYEELLELRRSYDSVTDALAAQKSVEQAKELLDAHARGSRRPRRSRACSARASSPASRSR